MDLEFEIESDGTLYFFNGPHYVIDAQRQHIPDTFTKIKFPPSFKKLVDRDFEYCYEGLAKVTVLDFQDATNLETIKNDTFTGAESLRAVSLPKKVQYINEFKDCPKLREIHIYNLNATYKITGDADKRLSVFASNVSYALKSFNERFLEDVGVLYVPCECIEQLQKALDDADDELDIRPLPEDYEFPDVVEYPLYTDYNDDDDDDDDENNDDENEDDDVYNKNENIENQSEEVIILNRIFDGTLYHCIINDQAFGPVTIRQFANMARYGIVNANTMVWTQGMSQWAIAQSIADLQTVV